MFCPACRADYPEGWKVCPKDATPLLRSAQIGKYTIDGTIGVGGMGAVYRATNPDTQSGVAVKVMHPHVAGAVDARKRFQREAAAVAKLNTAHVVKVNDFGTESDGTMYLVMELLAGHSLREEIPAPPALAGLARVQFVFDGSLKGLAAAHKAGIVHRDLKPENIFVASTDDGEVPKLLDFGIARVEAPGAELTRTGMMMGTASYMAPEQVAGKISEIGPWSDTYAMGVIMYELLTGQLAFGGNSLTEVLTKVLQGTVTPLRELRGGLPDKLYDLVDRCLSVDHTKRPQHADELRAALAEARLVPLGTAVPTFAGARPEEIATTIGATPVPPTIGTDPPAATPVPVAHVSVAPARTPVVTLDTVPPPPNRRALVLAVAGLAVVGVIVAIVAIKPGSKADPVANLHDSAVSDAPDAVVVDGEIESTDILARSPAATEVTVKHVLISWKELASAFRGQQDPRGAARSQADAAKLAREIADKLRAAPDQIDALVKANGEDPGSLSGDPYTVNATAQLTPEFKQLALRLKLGEVGIVKSTFGYHVMERVAPPPPDPLESAAILARPARSISVRVQHILIGWKDLATGKHDPRADKRTKADADKQAKAILDQVTAGADMAALMKEVSEDPGSKDDAKVYEITGNAKVPPPFKNLALRLNVGEAGMVRTPLGWHIIKRLPRLPPDPLDSTDILARAALTEKAKVEHILLSWNGIQSARDPRGKTRDRSALEKLVKQTLARLESGVKFEQLMSSLSEDPGSAKTGKSYDVTPDGGMVEPFENLSLRLHVNEVGVVKSDFGIHIIKRVE